MQTFETEQTARNYGLERNFGEYYFEHIKINGEKAILCGTDKPYEEELWGQAYELVQDFCKKFHNDEGTEKLDNDELEDFYSDFATDTASKIRDLVIKEYEDVMKSKFIDAHGEY